MDFSDVSFPASTRFLVTGAAGFIGSNLCEALLQQGYPVRGLDDFSVGRPSYIKELRQYKNFEFTRASITDIRACRKACCGVDYVLHQAALGSVPRSMAMPLEFDTVNVHGTLNMMQAADEVGVEKFVYASSSSVYGDEPSSAKVEGREGDILSPYAATKRIDEVYAAVYAKVYKLSTVGLRYFNVFGKRQDPHSTYAAVIPIFVRELLAGRSPEIFGDGSQTRDFVYIDDVVQANLRACLSGDETDGEAFNIASSQSITINELFDMIAGLLKKDIRPSYAPMREGDILHSLADTSKAQKFLHYAPQVDIHRGLEMTMDWYIRHLG